MTSRKILIRSAILLGSAIVSAIPVGAASLLVVDREHNALAIVDPVSRKVVARVPVGEEPHSVVAAADGKLAFVTNTGSAQSMGTISVVDLAARKELRQIKIGPHTRPHGIVVAAGKVYFTAEGYKMIGCYNPATDEMEWLLGTGQGQSVLIAVSKEADRIFTANVTSHTVTGIDVGGADNRGSPGGKDIERNPTNWNQVVIPVKTEPHPIAISPDSKEVWVGGRIDGNITIIDAVTKKILQTMELPSWRNGDRMAFTPDGKRLLLPNSAVPGKSGGGEVAVLDVITRKEIKRVPIGEGKQMQDLVVAPDGATAYVAVANENTIAVIDLKTLEVTDRIRIGEPPKGLTPEGVAWAR